MRALIKVAADALFPGPGAFTAGPFPAAKLDEIKRSFLPHTSADGMGCMQACYDILSILYSPPASTEMRKEVFRRAMVKAEEDARRNPAELQRQMDRVRALAREDGRTLTAAQVRQQALWQMTSRHNNVGDVFGLMQERGMAGEPVTLAYQARSKSWSPDADQAVGGLTAGPPGVYFFGMSVNDHHAATLAVDRRPDGTQKIYWFDQYRPGLSHEVTPGQLGAALQFSDGVNSSTTKIWPFHPPAPKP